jgi:hypothetical protein
MVVVWLYVALFGSSNTVAVWLYILGPYWCLYVVLFGSSNAVAVWLYILAL